MKYATKVKVINYTLPVVILVLFAKFGIQGMHKLFAQTPPTGVISLSVPQSSYTAGEDIVAKLSNISDNALEVANHCPGEPLSVYRLEGNMWVAIHSTAPASKCAGEPHTYTLPAHSSIPIDYAPWPRLFNQPGTYRIYATAGSSKQASIIEFTVTQ